MNNYAHDIYLSIHIYLYYICTWGGVVRGQGGGGGGDEGSSVLSLSVWLMFKCNVATPYKPLPHWKQTTLPDWLLTWISVQHTHLKKLNVKVLKLKVKCFVIIWFTLENQRIKTSLSNRSSIVQIWRRNISHKMSNQSSTCSLQSRGLRLRTSDGNGAVSHTESPQWGTADWN